MRHEMYETAHATLYNKLNPPMQEVVDAYATRLRPLAWNQKSDLLAAMALPLAEDFAPDKGPLAAQGFLTAVIERWNYPFIEDMDQACLYLVSLNPSHRRMAEEYLAEHPGAHGQPDWTLAEPS